MERVKELTLRGFLFILNYFKTKEKKRVSKCKNPVSE
jgi:hypothetical protein